MRETVTDDSSDSFKMSARQDQGDTVAADMTGMSSHHSVPMRGEQCSTRGTSDMGAVHDLMSEFVKHRDINKVEQKESKAGADSRNPLCAQKTSRVKHSAMLTEVRTLMNRYRDNYGRMRGWLSKLHVQAHPAWKKLPQWVEPSKVSHCFKCERRFRSQLQKINCRVGGQVFCSECCADCLVIYTVDEGDIMWGVNGKPSGPSTKPRNYSLLPVCSSCSQDLQDIAVDAANCSISQSTKFLEQLHCIHQTLSMLEVNVDVVFPKYLHLVDALSMDENSPNAIDQQNPFQYLARAQADLTDAFSVLATQFQKLKNLKPSSATEEILQSNVVQRTSKFLSQKSKFQIAKNRLSAIVPAEDLEKIQKDVCEQIIEQLYIYLKKLTFELSCLTQTCGFEDDISEPLQPIISSIEEEEPSVIKHKEVVYKTRGTGEGSFQIISIDPQATDQHAVRYIVISQISSSLREHYEQLLEKTIGREYLGIKEHLSRVFFEMESLQEVSFSPA